LVVSFLYLQICIFPEISWAVLVLSKYMIRPVPTHLVIAKKLLPYLKGRKNVTQRWCAQDCTGAHLPGTIYGYADASFADTIPHRHSSVGYFFLLNGAAIFWRTSRTTLMVLNAAEAELYSLSSATQEAIYLRKVCIKLGFLQKSPTTMYEDCQAVSLYPRKTDFAIAAKHLPSLELCCLTTKSRHWRHSLCQYQPHKYACRHILLASTHVELYFILRHNIGTPTDAHRIATNRGEGRLLLDLGSCRLWIPDGSLPCSPIHWHGLVMQNTTIVWLCINLMGNMSPKVFARKI